MQLFCFIRIIYILFNIPNSHYSEVGQGRCAHFATHKTNIEMKWEKVETKPLLPCNKPRILLPLAITFAATNKEIALLCTINKGERERELK